MIECVVVGAEVGVDVIRVEEAGAVVPAGEIVMVREVVVLVLGEEVDGVILGGVVAEEIAVVVFGVVYTWEEISGVVEEELAALASGNGDCVVVELSLIHI